jgi:hypothetical protein
MQLLDRLLLGEEGSGLAKALAGGAADVLEGILEETDQLAESHRFPEGGPVRPEEALQGPLVSARRGWTPATWSRPMNSPAP